MKKPQDRYAVLTYTPDEFGVEILEELNDPDACYSFDTFLIGWDIESKRVFYATDSGCSCPSPFEWVKGDGDVDWVYDDRTLARMEEALNEWNKSGYRDKPYVSPQAIQNAVRIARDKLTMEES